MSHVTLHLGGCLEVMKTLDAESVDAIITDLPYGTTYLNFDSAIPLAPMWEAVRRVLKPKGTFVTTASQPFTTTLIVSNPEWFRYALVWEKSVATGFLDANRKPLKAHEDICIFAKGLYTYNPQMIEGKPWKKNDRNEGRATHYRTTPALDRESDGARYPRSVVKFSNGNNHNDGHPTQKPVALMAYLIRTYTNPGDTVLDFCMGSGTTGVAAVKEGRHFVGIELDSVYFAIAQRRTEQAQMQLPLGLEEANHVP